MGYENFFRSISRISGEFFGVLYVTRKFCKIFSSKCTNISPAAPRSRENTCIPRENAV